MIQWKQRLYAFLLRRGLGPFLDAEATKQLHDLIDVSLNDGTFVLKDVCLNSAHLTEILATHQSPVAVRKAIIRKLEIRLTLRENATTANNAAPQQQQQQQSSLAWRAMQLGSASTAFPAVSLIAEILVDGVELELIPADPSTTQRVFAKRQAEQTQTDTATDQASAKSVLGSYIDAALASLKLSLQLSNVTIKLSGATTTATTNTTNTEYQESWVALKLSSVIYKDVDLQSNDDAATSKLLVSKSLDISELSILTGGERMDPSGITTGPHSQRVAMAQGTGRIYYRLLENTTRKNFRDEGTTSLQQDIEVGLNHQLNFSVDKESIFFIMQVLDSFSNTTAAPDSNDSMPAISSSLQESPLLSSVQQHQTSEYEADDREDLKTITGIMKQYREAYHLAENNQLRGGILVPSHAYLDDVDALEEDDAMTFDVFFDANEQSFYNSASALRESIAIQRDPDDNDGGGMQLHLKLHLLSGCIKINFPQDSGTGWGPQEYALMTMDDLNVSYSSSASRSDVNLTVAHFEVEDAQLEPPTADESDMAGTIDIGSLFSFSQLETDGDDYDHNAVVSQAPCLSLHIQQHKRSDEKKTDVNVTLSPIQLAARQRTLQNFSAFVSDIKNEAKPSTDPPPTSDSVQTTGRREELSATCSCPSITVTIPLASDVSTNALFNRCGETLEQSDNNTNPSIGIVLDTLSLTYRANTPEDRNEGLQSFSELTFCHMIVFASAPMGDERSMSPKLQRFDIALFNGRTEVTPYIPISVEFKTMISGSGGGEKINRDFFPLVPAISSFKARQEDEDEETKIDRLLFSKLHDVDADTRKSLRGADPQIAMVTDAEKSASLLVVSIPEMIVDLTRTELETLSRMRQSISLPSSSQESTSRAKAPETKKVTTTTAIAIGIDQITMSIKDDFKVEDLYGKEKKRFSCAVALDQFKTHVLLAGSQLRNLRVLAHDLCLYSAMHPRIEPEVKRRERSINERVQMVKQRIRTYTEATLTPILYRSQAFTPICQEAPSFLFDVRDLSTADDLAKGAAQKQVHVTLYHLTFRYNIDSDWIDKVKMLLPQSETSMSSEQTNEKESRSTKSSMTRLFVSVADCNLDYASPAYFLMTSRSIVRIGDLRFSSNIMNPPAPNQAYSLSVGDFSYHINNYRLSYATEDMRLCRAKVLMRRPQRSAPSGKHPIHGTTAEALLREMGFIEVLGLDSMDAIIATTKWDSSNRKRDLVKDPSSATSLTFGLLSVSACKDSFNCFATTVGEVQTKLTALSDANIEEMKSQGSSTRSASKSDRPKAPKHVRKPYSTSSPTKIYKEKSSEALLLDGYDWTEIDHDPLPEMEIPDGEEQVAGWYRGKPMNRLVGSVVHGTSKMTTTATNRVKEVEEQVADGVKHEVEVAVEQVKKIPSKLIHHHFPVHSVSDPLADSDLGAVKLAGEGALLSLKSRLVIHRLTVKLKFHDGYDWPEKLTQKTKESLNKHGNFVIEALLKAEHAKEESSEMDDEIDQLKRTGKLMSDLLQSPGERSSDSPFDDTPLPEDRAKRLQSDAELRRLSRKTKTYLQVSANGVTVRVDSFDSSWTHRLASILAVSVAEMFIAESASLSYPVKMLGEWVNDNEHPRDTRCGTIMLKMITWKPERLVTEDNEVQSDDCEASVQILPMRVILDQRAIHFAQAFFRGEEKSEDKKDWTAGLHMIPPPRFRAFRVRPWKLKVDYMPQKMDVGALRDGSVVELINIIPIDGMIITLSEVVVENGFGFGEVMSGLTGRWLQEVVSTQLHKFVANARPFEPLTDVGQGISDLVVLPYEAFKNGDAVQRAMTSGVKSLAETLTFQTLTTTSRLTEYAANKMANFIGGRYPGSAANPLPIRPTAAPKGVQDVTGHAMQSLARGFQAANYKVVIVPYREYGRNGATGAASSVLRGIPVMMVAPMTGAAEALSYTLLGARNALRPDLRREEEAARTGFTSYDV